MNYMEQVAKMLGVKSYEEFNLSSFGSRKFRFTEQGLEYFHEPTEKWALSGLLYRILEGTYEIVKIPILDEAEKEYLSNIIKPFRDRVKCISKNRFDDFEYIYITYFNKLGNKDYVLDLSIFEDGAMYKGMETNKHYTLDELGL